MNKNLEDLTPAELSTNSPALVERLACERKMLARFCKGCGMRVGLEHASNCDVEPGGEFVLVAQCDPLPTPDPASTVELEPGPYSLFVLHENGTWEQPTYRVPAGWTENEVRRAVEAESRRVVHVSDPCRDDDCPEESMRSMPDVEIEPDPRPGEFGPVEVMQVAVLSTRHLSAEEGQRNADKWPTHTHESEHGFVAYVGGEVDLLEVLGTDGLEEWPGFVAAVEWARSWSLDWVRFDADGPEQPGLPEWEW